MGSWQVRRIESSGTTQQAADSAVKQLTFQKFFVVYFLEIYIIFYTKKLQEMSRNTQKLG